MTMVTRTALVGTANSMDVIININKLEFHIIKAFEGDINNCPRGVNKLEQQLILS
jgi:hypothetical protein